MEEIAEVYARSLFEVANLTVMATEKVTRMSLDDDEHKRLIEEALSEVDFSALSGSEGRS